MIINKAPTTPWELRKRSRKLYPTSRFMRHQWVRKTNYLLQTGNHLLYRSN